VHFFETKIKKEKCSKRLGVVVRREEERRILVDHTGARKRGGAMRKQGNCDRAKKGSRRSK